jgi:serine/threonine-protein kinase
MDLSATVGGEPVPSLEAVRDQLQRLLASPCFADAPRLRALLAFLVEQTICGHGGELKESVIAVEVFGRAADFDRRVDSVVRVQARNLRAKLRAYYEQDGRDDAIRFDLPSGSYVPVFQTTQAATPEAPAVVESRTWLTRRRVALAALALLLAIAGLVALLRFPWAPSRRSVAVLPFLNLTGNVGSDYFVDGFVDELTTSLAQVKGLHVVARTSAFQFRGKSPDIRTAGRQLGVATVLEGSVRSVGGTVRLSAQLIDVKDGFHLWSHTYEGSGQDVFTIREEIAAAVSAALDLAAPSRAGAPTPRPGLEAYDLYLKGQYFKERVTLEDLARSIQFFQQSIQRDPGFAAAHAALADAYASMAYHQITPDRSAIAKAKAEAARALELNGSLAEPHALLAWIRFFYDWNWPDAASGFRRALELNPSSARAHDWFSQYLLSAGRFDEAVAESRKALLLDPLTYRVSTNLCVTYYCAHRYDQAIRQARGALDINPHFYQAQSMLGASMQKKGRLPEARAALQAAMSEYAGDADARAHLAVVEAALGRGGAIQDAIAALGQRPGASHELAYLYLALGDRSRAFEFLQKAFDDRSSDMPFLDVDPAFDSLRSDPRYAGLRRKMGWE